MAINQQITSAPPAPQRSDPNTFADKADAFVAWLENLDDELNQWASECNATAEDINSFKPELFLATSNTTITVETGAKTFTLNEEKRAFGIGNKLRIVSASDPTNVWMEGIVINYTNNDLTVNVGSASGSGTYSDWKIAINAGSDASSVNGFSVSQTPQSNTIPVADENGKLDDWLSENITNWQQNFSQNGYTKMPNGLIIQWGRSYINSYSNGGNATTVTFPISFPNECLVVVNTPYNNSNKIVYIKGQSKDNFQAYCYHHEDCNTYINWIALGY